MVKGANFPCSSPINWKIPIFGFAIRRYPLYTISRVATTNRQSWSVHMLLHLLDSEICQASTCKALGWSSSGCIWWIVSWKSSQELLVLLAIDIILVIHMWNSKVPHIIFHYVACCVVTPHHPNPPLIYKRLWNWLGHWKWWELCSYSYVNICVRFGLLKVLEHLQNRILGSHLLHILTYFNCVFLLVIVHNFYISIHMLI